MSSSWNARFSSHAPASDAPLASVADVSTHARRRATALAGKLPRPELLGLMALAATLNLWALAQNGWANTYYAAAVRSMSTSWHNFLFASLDPAGVMTVDKPPLALWVQALSVRVFGYHSLSILVPQALMGVASVVLTYDLVRRRFGRVGGFVGGLALALTPITVAISRHNNPDALLVLCCVAALWCAVRALESGRTRWLVASGVCVGLGFETKMGVALVVVPGIAAAWMWIAPAGRGRLHALRQLLAGGAAMTLVGGAWPALVELTPAADRPWISGTSNNTILSLILEYNGAGRVGGESGVPTGSFGSSPGPLRLIGAALGGQAGWLLGFAIVTALAMLVACRLRRSDARSGWLMAVGGSFLATAVLFSAAGGIFHPYYVSLLAPFVAALVGAGAGQLIAGRLWPRVVGPMAIAAGVAIELVVAGNYSGQLEWLTPLLLAVGSVAIIALLALRDARVRAVAVAVALGALLLAPATWAVDTLGYATSSTFPAGGPQSVASAAGGMGGPGGGRSQGGLRRAFGAGGFPGGNTARTGAPPASGAQLFGGSTNNASGGAGAGGGLPGGGPAGPGGGFGGTRGAGSSGGGLGGIGGGQFGGQSLTTVLSYIKAHGGGTLAVSSQSSAASAIIEDGASVAGIGGFTGRESDVSVAWLAQEVRAGKIRWVLGEQQGSGGFAGSFGGGRTNDTRTGSKTALAAVEKVCTAVTVTTSSAKSSSSGSAASNSGTTLYDCSGHAAALERA